MYHLIVRLMLEQEEFNVKYAYSGSQLFAVLKEQKPALIILDVMMPLMDGLEVLRRLEGCSGDFVYSRDLANGTGPVCG